MNYHDLFLLYKRQVEETPESKFNGWESLHSANLIKSELGQRLILIEPLQSFEKLNKSVQVSSSKQKLTYIQINLIFFPAVGNADNFTDDSFVSVTRAFPTKLYSF